MSDCSVPVEPPRRAAVWGSPVSHSLSPVLHRSAYAALGLHGWRYDRAAVGGPGEPDVVEALAGLGPEWVGLSLTMPNKEAALAAADEVSERAQLAGGANTLVRREGRWYADSTDAYGLEMTLRETGIRTAGCRALVLGSGATARAACVALAAVGADEVVFAVRDGIREQTRQTAEQLGLTVGQIPLSRLQDQAVHHPLLISTLPTGIDLGLDRVQGAPGPGQVVIDVVYGCWPTPLAQWAESGGATVVSGALMLLHQAAEQVRIMTGRPAPLAEMRAALTAAVDAGTTRR